MTPELQVLGRRAVALDGWRWMPGVRWEEVPPPPRGCGAGCGRVDDGQDTTHFGHLGELPDFSDPATVGCLRAMVEAKYGPLTHLAPFHTHVNDPADPQRLIPAIWWAVSVTETAKLLRSARGGYAAGPTKVHAMIEALESGTATTGQ